LPVDTGVDRVTLIKLLSGSDRSEASAVVTELEEMVTDIKHISDEESERLAGESRAARTLDRQLAGDLRRRRPGGETSSAGICGSSGSARDCRPRPSGSWSPQRGRVTAAPARNSSRRSCR
jgi:hypothetical protein